MSRNRENKWFINHFSSLAFVWLREKKAKFSSNNSAPLRYSYRHIFICWTLNYENDTWKIIIIAFSWLAVIGMRGNCRLPLLPSRPNGRTNMEESARKQKWHMICDKHFVILNSYIVIKIVNHYYYGLMSKWSWSGILFAQIRFNWNKQNCASVLIKHLWADFILFPLLLDNLLEGSMI